MILIFTGQNEVGNHSVLDWLLHFNEPFIRVTEKSQLNIIDFSIVNEHVHFKIDIEGTLVPIEKIKSYWVRQGYFTLNKVKFQNLTEDNNLFTNHLSQEISTFTDHITSIIMTKHGLGKFNEQNVNKLTSIITAAKAGFHTPNTYVCNTKDSLRRISIDKKYITKSISDVLRVNIEQETYLTYTEEINDKLLENLPDVFFPSLIQEKIEKDYEVRTFFLDNECYSVAIFSQKRTNTAIDFRKYDNTKRSRMIPYKLPIEIEKKVTAYMNIMGHKTGSLDFIKDKNGNYIFLEMNPVGQYGFVSYLGNYNLDKKIAEYLIKI